MIENIKYKAFVFQSRNGTRNGFIVVSELTIQHVMKDWNSMKISCIATYGSRANTFEHTVHMKLKCEFRVLPKNQVESFWSSLHLNSKQKVDGMLNCLISDLKLLPWR